MRRRSESLAPSLFPFLAVLLCTMGALVLMLLLLVVGAQSSAKEVAEKIEDEFEWEQEKLTLVKSSLVKRYEETKYEIESKRLHLQNIEQHIHQLTEELDELEKTAIAVEKSRDEKIELQKKERDQLREALEKQLADAKKKIETKSKDPKGDKPIFAIIPYEGANGTHRRPIYLECNAKGLVVQPEGVVLSPADLAPPYGPGNPLDSVLRTIRAEYPSTSGSLTSNPYPLIVVRPSGIKNYMMARAAMSGWDDQFGYELISEEMELTFPAGAPNLEKKIVSAIEVARERQAALVLSMPQHYNASQLDSYGGAGGGWDESSEDITGVFDSTQTGSGKEGSIGGSSARSGGGRGGMSMIGSPGGISGNPSSDATATNRPGGQSGPGGTGSSPNLAQSLAQSGNGKSNGNGWTFEQSINSAQGAAGGPPNIAGTADKLAAGGNSGGGSGGSMSFFGGGSSDELRGLSGGTASGNTSFGGSGGGEASGGDVMGGPGDNSTSSSGANGSGSASAAGAGSPGSGSAGTGSSSGGSASQSSGNQNSNSSNRQNSGNSATAGGPTSGGSSGGGAGGAPASGGQFSIDPMTDPGSVSGSRSGASGDPSQMSGEVQNIGMNVDMSKKSRDQTKSVAQSKGRGWAWRDGNNSKTAIVRAIWLQCYNDQWIIRPDKGSNAAPTVINLDGSAMERAEQLAQAVRDRVQGWGMAIAGGHWTPVIHVEVATDAEARFQQLQKLMEGSGIEVIRKSSIPPKLPR